MKHHGLDPQQHFEFMFKAKIEPTGRVRTQIQDVMPMIYSDPIPLDIQYEVEREIALTMGERDYKNFMASYGKYLDVVYAAEKDPIVNDMLHKMIMYITLKHQ